jgi:hypothetical protein
MELLKIYIYILKFNIFFINLKLSCSQLNEDICKINQNCQLPSCHCDSTYLPENLTSKYRLDEIPQLVILTIDDDQLDVKSYQVYKRLFENFINPNRCPLRATFFVSDSYNKSSYCLIRNLFEKKHEIAISTLNLTCPHKLCSADKYFKSWSYSRWSEQINGMRQRLNRYAAIPKSEINGFRAPLMEPSADIHYKIIATNKFIYDSSLILNEEKIIWPFTLDYSINSSLSNNGPINRYPGLWELPVSTYNNDKISKTFLHYIYFYIIFIR